LAAAQRRGHRALLERWLPAKRVEAVLKTDLFDEAFGEGLVPVLAARAEAVHSIDVAEPVIAIARERNPGLHALRADIRELPFADAMFDVVVSISTLDHFPSHGGHRRCPRADPPHAQTGRGLDPDARQPRQSAHCAAQRVCRFARCRPPGWCPTTSARPTGRAAWSACLGQSGFTVLETTATLHCPRVLAISPRRLAPEEGPTGDARPLRPRPPRFERLAAWPTRYWTGHYVAVRAVKS
jgi:SAM-dependent methyltransferase